MPAVAPGLAEALLVLLRWLHGLATIALLGWVFVFLVIERRPDGGTALAARFKEITDTTMLVFLATGAVLSFDRLSRGAGTWYAMLLALKILLAVGAYQYAFRWRRDGMPQSGWDGRLILILGAGAVLLAAVLKEVFERGLRN